MSRPRTITVTLTEPQYSALTKAVAMRDADFEDDYPTPTEARRDERVLDAAWEKIRRAWLAT